METIPKPLKVQYIALLFIFITETAAGQVHALPFMAKLSLLRLFQTFSILSLYHFFSPQGLADLGLHRDGYLRGTGKGLLWSSVFGGVVLFAAAVLFFAGTDPLSLIAVSTKPAPMALFLFAGCFAGPVAEEILFRGIVYRFFRNRGVATAIIASTLVFALLHGSGIPFVPAVGGILFALSYEKEGHLMTPITIHILGNTAIFTLSFI